MKIIAIGDPHGSLDKIKQLPLENIDLILLTGDLGSANLARKMAFENVERRKQGLSEKNYSPSQRKRAYMEAYTSTIRILRHLGKYAPVLTIYGNVELSRSETRKLSKEIGTDLPYLTDSLNKINNVKVINNKLVTINGIRIGGLEYFVDTNWVRDFKPSDYQKRMKDAKKQSDKAKKTLSRFNQLDILVCHQPPLGYLDKVTAKFAPKHWQGKHAGSKTVLEYIKRKSPKYIFCGHIHEGQGKVEVGKSKVYNLGVCNYRTITI